MALSQLRTRLRTKGLAAFIVGSEDAHQSEYVADHDLRRAFISKFTGSAGTALITLDRALLWTDGRYFLQASMEMSSEWELMRSGEPNVPSMVQWLAGNLKAGDQVGVDPWLVTGGYARDLTSELGPIGASLVAVDENPIDAIWLDQPPQQFNRVHLHPLAFAGVDVATKLQTIRQIMTDNHKDALILTALDEVAWTFNLRGSDITYNPLLLAYAIITRDGCRIFNDDIASRSAGGDDDDVLTELRGCGVTIHPYHDIVTQVMALNNNVWISSSESPWKLTQLCPSSSSSLPSPIQLIKSIKNDVEIAGMMNAHIRDGVALTAFFAWVDGSWNSANRPVDWSEWSLCEVLADYRSKQALFAGLSFPTICGYGPNGAVIHYHTTATNNSPITIGGSLLLIDSGAQFLDGTTDVTRTVYLPVTNEEPSQIYKEAFTRVLKGVIAIGSVKFPIHTLGSRLDALARSALWEIGLDYKHGTGHGVGAYLNVHEGPQGIGYRKRFNEVGFQPGMTVSDEPGYYEDGKFGIRIENVCVCRQSSTQFSFGNLCYCEFDTITLAPIQRCLIDATLLNDKEKDWLNAYHDRVRSVLEPLLRVQYPQALGYLMKETEPIID